MIYTALPFGKHKGKTLPFVIFNDPDWFFWAMEKSIFRGALAKEADELYDKARSIRIPGRDDNNPLEAEYSVDYDSGGLEGFRIVHEEEYQDTYSYKIYRSKVIDVGFITAVSKKDTVGRERVLKKGLKFYLFGSSKIRLTTKMCEAFFETAENFVIGA